eukprot:5596148-Pleurochrysis_carterae.AAC.1
MEAALRLFWRDALAHAEHAHAHTHAHAHEHAHEHEHEHAHPYAFAPEMYDAACNTCSTPNGAAVVHRPDHAPPLLQLPPLPRPLEPLPRQPRGAPLPPPDTLVDEIAEAAQRRLATLLVISLAHGVPLPAWMPPSTFRSLLGNFDEISIQDLQARARAQ